MTGDINSNRKAAQPNHVLHDRTAFPWHSHSRSKKLAVEVKIDEITLDALVSPLPTNFAKFF